MLYRRRQRVNRDYASHPRGAGRRLGERQTVRGPALLRSRKQWLSFRTIALEFLLVCLYYMPGQEKAKHRRYRSLWAPHGENMHCGQLACYLLRA